MRCLRDTRWAGLGSWPQVPKGRTLCESRNAASSCHPVQLPVSRAGSRQVTGSEATTVDPCGALGLSSLLICVLEATLEVSLSKHSVLQEKKTEKKRIGNMLQE